MKPIESSSRGVETFDWLPALAALGLSRQQQRVVAMILDGKGDKQIAAGMGIGFSTVRTYLERIFARFQVADRHELLLYLFDVARGLDAVHDRMTTDSKTNDSEETDSMNADGVINVGTNTDLFTTVQKRHSAGRRRGSARAGTVSASRPPKVSSLRNGRERQETAVDRKAGRAGE
ncbi:MAG: helix-turn-helix transcriptional regulator [Planctomycetota bacterium]